MKKVLSFVLFAFVSTGIFAQTTWNADKAHSQVLFEITHMGIADVEGNFGSFDANIVTNKEDFSDAVFDVKIDVNSIDTGVERRDNHLRSADFFEVEKYPEMTFKSKKIQKVAENKYKVTGDLTFHGVTKPATLDVWYRGTNKSDKGEVSGFEITGEISRSDYNLAPGFPAAALSDEVRIRVNGEFKKA